MLSNCGVRKNSCSAVPCSARRSNHSFLKEINSRHSLEGLLWSWSSNTLAIWCKESTHWKRPWCWKRLRAGGEGDNRGWNGWMASSTWWTWVWVDSGSWWCHPTISSYVTPFSCPQSFPASGSFPMSQFFALGGQSIGASASASVLPMNISPLWLTGLISLKSKGLSRVFSNATVQKHQFFGTQLSL